MWLWGVWLCAHPTTWESGDLDQVPPPWFPTLVSHLSYGGNNRIIRQVEREPT